MLRRARGLPATPETALTELDAQWNLHRDPSLVLEVAALGLDQRDRAVARASSAGEETPQSYETYRRYLPGAAALEADRFVGGTLALRVPEARSALRAPFARRAATVTGS